jgi:hypothetical protein
LMASTGGAIVTLARSACVPCCWPSIVSADLRARPAG